MFSIFNWHKIKIKKMLQQGAVVIDIRTPMEYDKGRVPNSINIPLDRLLLNTEKIKSIQQPIIVCCASGIRSSQAKKLIQLLGKKDIVNGGSWQSILKYYNEM